ncbi:unnamed protein product [Bursaphelenchus okinawaensis]|uniref:Uncharacterized protein n=1 Tax=Bursaphelenchus okinawaensis TaxID=465554 RepID=A0A811JQL6_9BILA|nr:unnamed protein product [Bursaphelenchus okinawaensis]CAG9078032.1 unnamed protein product [Bursaphelenchus okinawaensis]
MVDFVGLKGKNVVITGAAQGIGAATAKKFAELGANVVLVDINEQALNSTVQTIQQEFPSIKVVPSVLNVSQKANVDELVKNIEKILPEGMDVVVNNAGTISKGVYIDVTEEDFVRVMNNNLMSTHFVSQAFSRQAIQLNKPLSIVNISSLATTSGQPNIASYIASKSAIEGLTKGLAKELGKHKIRVNAVKPGVIDTPINQQIPAQYKQMFLMQTPLDRVGEAEEVANCVAFLASDASSFVTGAMLDISGGLSF